MSCNSSVSFFTSLLNYFVLSTMMLDQKLNQKLNQFNLKQIHLFYFLCLNKKVISTQNVSFDLEQNRLHQRLKCKIRFHQIAGGGTTATSFIIS